MKWFKKEEKTINGFCEFVIFLYEDMSRFFGFYVFKYEKKSNNMFLCGCFVLAIQIYYINGYDECNGFTVKGDVWVLLFWKEKRVGLIPGKHWIILISYQKWGTLFSFSWLIITEL